MGKTRVHDIYDLLKKNGYGETAMVAFGAWIMSKTAKRALWKRFSAAERVSRARAAASARWAAVRAAASENGGEKA
jgi:hypothetical protein